MPEPLHRFEQEPLGDHLPALCTQPGAPRAARHVAVDGEPVLVVILLTCSQSNKRRTLYMQHGTSITNDVLMQLCILDTKGKSNGLI